MGSVENETAFADLNTISRAAHIKHNTQLSLIEDGGDSGRHTRSTVLEMLDALRQIKM